MSQHPREHESSDRPAPPVPGEQLDRAGLGRRRLIRAGASAAPVILTVTSRPVLAWDCKAPSAHASLSHASHHPGKGLVNEGTRTIYYWDHKDSVWPSPYHRNTTKMHSATAFPGNQYGNALMKDVLRANSTSQLHKFLIAAYLNAKLVPNVGLCLSHAQLCSMYTHGPAGTYQPSPGINWGSSQIVLYLKNNWIVTG